MKNTSVLALLEHVDERLEKARLVRNAIAHKGDYKDTDLVSIKAMLELADMVEDAELRAQVYQDHFATDINKKVNRQQQRVFNDMESIAKVHIALNHLLVAEFRRKIATFEPATYSAT